MSTIALWPGVLASAYGYKSEMADDSRKYWPFVVIGCLGGAAGPFCSFTCPNSYSNVKSPGSCSRLRSFLVWALKIIGVRGQGSEVRKRFPFLTPDLRSLAPYALQCVIAIYGGYFGAGIGILTLAMLQIMGHTHIHRMNALKTLLTGTKTKAKAKVDEKKDTSKTSK